VPQVGLASPPAAPITSVAGRHDLTGPSPSKNQANKTKKKPEA
jgi:hypothetical protein